MTTREHCLELVNAEIDGELTGPQRAELNRLLLADPDLRALRDELRQTCAAIDALPGEELPPDLHAAILASLPSRPVDCAEPRRRPVPRVPVWRYAASFAAGIVASALAFQAGLFHDDKLDSRSLSGTIASVAADPSRLELRSDGIHGSVEVEGSSQAPVVRANLASQRPIEVVAGLDGQEIRLGDFTALQNEPVELRAGFSHRDAAGPVRISIRVVETGSGEVLRTATLRPNVPGEK